MYGYSQSATVATVATVEKRFLAQNPVPGTTVGFNLIANPNRPDGGILERFAGLYIPIVGVTFNGATPTDTGMPTVDVAREYDGWADFPTNPLNPLADVKAGLGIDPPKKPTTPTVGKPLGPGLGGLNKLVSSSAGALKNSSARTPVSAGGAPGSTGDK
ncbi:MAG: hypothetical protein QOC62_1367 [Mycobacterium sp.]|nr:hypothetical protein [Mycobacterium sp.]